MKVLASNIAVLPPSGKIPVIKGVNRHKLSKIKFTFCQLKMEN